MNDQAVIIVIAMTGAALTMALGAVGAAIGESRIGAAAMDALARQPDEAASITRTLFVSLAMVESTAIFCLVIALILLFANPFTSGAHAARAAGFAAGWMLAV
jgi:F-type H+-transporting ATPase subunit c